MWLSIPKPDSMNSPRMCDLSLAKQKKSSSLMSGQQSQFQTEVHHQGLEADKTRERDLFSSQADNQELIKQVQEDVHGVTCEEAEWALRRNQWDFTHAVQQLKVNQLFNADLGSQEECKQTLILFHWNLEKASNALTRQGRDTYVKKQF